MANRALIEIQDKQGVWIYFRKVANNSESIKQALQAALEMPMASTSKKVRAIDAVTNIVIKVENG